MKKKKILLILLALCVPAMLWAGANHEAATETEAVPSFVRFVCTIFGQDPGDPANFFMFIGRFHPLVLHLPLGILAMVMCLEVYGWLKKSDQLHEAVYLGIGAGTISAWVAVLCGSFLAMSNDFGAELINRHGWLGLVLAVFTTIAFLCKKKYINSDRQSKGSRKGFLVSLGACMLLMSLVGHDGGSISHGEKYLFEFAPDFVRNIVGLPDKKPKGAGPDINKSIYAELIAPMMEKRCAECHSEKKKKGKLRLDTPEWIMKGGKADNLIVFGNAEKSYFYELLVTEDEDEIMPPEGKTPCTAQEIALIKWWIDSSKNNDDLFKRTIKDSNIPPEFLKMKAGKVAKGKPHATPTNVKPDQSTEDIKKDVEDVKKDVEDVKKDVEDVKKDAEDVKKGVEDVKKGVEDVKKDTEVKASGNDPLFAKVQLIFEARCIKCHGEKKQKGEYRMDTAEHVFVSGDSEEEPIKKGDAGKSYLYQLITMSEDDDEVMPPKGGLLTKEEIATVEAWIKAGAKFPANAALEDKSKKK